MKQAPALRSNNQTHPPRTHRPWHRRTRSPRSAVGTTAPGRPDDALLGPSDVRQWMSIRQHGRGRDGCRMPPSLVRVLVGNVGGYWGSPGRPEPCWAGGRGRMGRCGDADARKASGCPSWCRSASGRGIVCPWLSARGLWVCAALPDRLGRIPGGQTGNFRKWIRFRCDLRLATATATLSLCWQDVRPSKYFPVTNLGGAREGVRSKRCVSWVRFDFDSRFTAVSLEFVRVLVFVPRRWRESRGCRAARGARRGRCEWAE